jgi:hypothetical protein
LPQKHIIIKHIIILYVVMVNVPNEFIGPISGSRGITGRISNKSPVVINTTYLKGDKGDKGDKGETGDSATNVRWFGPPKYNCYPNISFIPLNSVTLNTASCTYASFDGATSANFAIGMRILIPTGSNSGVWVVNSNKTSLTRDTSFTVVKGQIVRAVYSAGSPQYIQTAHTDAATPIFSLQQEPLGDWTDLCSALIEESTQTHPRTIRLVNSSTPYIAEVTGEIPAALSNGAIDLNGAEICATMPPTSGAPLPAMCS